MEDPGTGADPKNVTNNNLKQRLLDSKLRSLASGSADALQAWGEGREGRVTGGGNQSGVVAAVGLGYSSGQARCVCVCVCMCACECSQRYSDSECIEKVHCGCVSFFFYTLSLTVNVSSRYTVRSWSL